jgi:hypothetical protein
MQVVGELDLNGEIIVIKELALRPNLSSISLLNLTRCSISDLAGFPPLPQLEKLILQHNNIEKGLNALGNAKLTSLAHLDISFNPIWNFCEIVSLERLPRLNHFSCQDCPVMSTPFLRKMCFGYLYNLHSLNGIDGVAEPDSGSDDDPPIRNMMNGASKLLFPSKKKEFKLYNDFSHCPIISTQTWVKKSEVPVPLETLKRQISHMDNDKTTAEYGPSEKKRKENGSPEFNLNKEEDNTHDNSTTPSEHASDSQQQAVMAAVANILAHPMHHVTHHESLNPSLSQNLMKNYIKQDPPNSNQHMDSNRGLHASTNTDDDDDEDDSYADGESDSDAGDSDSGGGMDVDDARRNNYQPTGNVYMTKKRVDSNEMRPQYNNQSNGSSSNQSNERGNVRNNSYATNSSNQGRDADSSEEGSVTEDDNDSPTDSRAPHTQ